MNMTPQRYRQVGELYHAALELETDERDAFLDRACEGDEDLRREVESLIESHERSADFIVEPALAEAAQALADSKSTELIGQTIARYRVLSLIGAGGMGRVYLAEDIVLGRRVALKLLPEHFTNDKNQVQRFRLEARAASALNHPNILTVHEVGQVDGVEFIATEYVEGETLRARLTRTPLNIREALDIAAQVADALVAAHEAGIIHRDIKPENIVIRRDGYVKVLDFGLAKLTENISVPQLAELDAPTAIRTNPGIVMGTAEYMSPEQARGLKVDARTDVWSLGVVVYEMLAGRRPFEGATHGDVIVSLLEKEPLLITRHLPEAPAELERIVTKALTKNREQRYQTLKDMAIDLRRLKQRLEIEAEIGRSQFPEVSGKGAPPATDGHEELALDRGPGVKGTRHDAAAAPTSSLEYAVSEIKRHKVGVVMACVISITALFGGGYGLYRVLNRNSVTPFQSMKFTQLTTDGNARSAAISPDGKYVAYVLRSGAKETLRVRQLTTSSDLQVVPPAETVFVGVTFSRDGDYLYYVTIDERGAPRFLLESNARGTLHTVPALGGASRRLLEGVDSPIAFSPDGGSFAFVRTDPDQRETALIVANADGSGERRLASRPPPDVYLSRGQFGGVGPAWSPDGKVIACGVGPFFRLRVVAVSAIDGSETLLGSQEWTFLGRMAWLSDGSGLVVLAMDQKFSTQLWQLSYPLGEVRRITNDLNVYSDVGLDANARSLVTVQADSLTKHLWVVTPGEDTSSASKIVSIRGMRAEAPSWTPDGRIVYSAIVGDNTNLWVINQDGTEQKQLTTFTNPSSVRPSVSPSGRHIVFVSDRAGKRNLWRVDIDGSNPVRLTNGDLDTWPTWSPDGRWVVYVSLVAGKPSLWKAAIEGGNPVQLTTNNFVFSRPSVSPDGKLVAYSNRDEHAGSPVRIMVVPFDGGNPIRTLDLSSSAKLEVNVRWTSDGRALTHVDTRDGVDNVWSRPLDGGSPTQITDFKSDEIFMFDWSRDGKQLALWRGTPTSNVVLISDFK